MDRPDDLTTEVGRLVNLGHKDPLEIARLIAKDHDPQWLRDELEMLAEDIVADLARRLLNARRRQFEVALRPGDEMASAEMKTAGLWIPGPEGFSVWKKAADCTPEDLRRKAAFYEAIGVGALKRASWLREVAGMIEAEGCGKLGRLKAELPPLPGVDDLGLPVAAVA